MGKIKHFTVEHVYKVHIEFAFHYFTDVLQLDTLMVTTKPEDIQIIEFSTGGNCFNPYFILESKDETALAVYTGQVLDYAESLGGFKIIG